jgi:mannose-binding lectin 2
VEGDGKWSTCFYMPDVYLPTGYFLGFSAATGDLADNHDIIYIQTAEPPKLTVEEVEEMQRVEKEKVKTAETGHVVVGPDRAGAGVGEN